ncbi:hypothetical protein [Pseudomonas sp. CC6-YY-74]|uniref:hypothetical protein n=1 Tax=Pseudomonas sp. CC6-YY-74 TaxID=1930532 RepID=UPI0012AC0932|nr:hypothetical protein [Pseudomonas sp. CC6-YY-74]
MKKLILSVGILASFCASTAFATNNAAEAISSGNLIVLTDCDLLADDVTLNLSNGVLANYFCRLPVPGTPGEVVVATCHENGRTSTRTIESVCTNTTPVPAGQVACADPTIPFNTATSQGASIFQGRTSGGSIGPTALDGAVCTAAGVATRSN